MQVILNYGMGVDSTVILHRWLTQPETRDFDLKDLIVVSAQTGNEFPDTKRVVQSHILPLLRGMGIRYVQLARGGPERKDGIKVLSDTNEPDTLHIEGAFSLADELLRAGTVPQVAARRCSEKFKGWVIDFWLSLHIEGAFRQIMGFNADEQKRVTRDSCYGGDNRHAEYPLMKWGMGRKACEEYLLRELGLNWPKSCCVFCPFAAGKEEIRARYTIMPDQAAEALFLEWVSMALNPRMHLYATKSLRSVLKEHFIDEALDILENILDRSPWALYRIRRLYWAKGRADRSVEMVHQGTRREVGESLSRRAQEGEEERNGGHHRVYLRRREPEVYPTGEECFVAAPAVVQSKARPKFEQNWSRLTLQEVAFS